MANTKISFITYDGETPRVYLSGLPESIGTPNPSGYLASDVLDPGLYLATIPENLEGEFSVKAVDSLSGILFRGYVTLVNDTNTYRCYDYANINLDDLVVAIGQVSASVVLPAASLPSTSQNNLSLFQGTEWNFSISGIGTNADDFYFTMKSVNSMDDNESDLQINTNGTKYIKQTEYITTSGSLVYTSGTIHISVQPEVTDLICGGRKYNWDIKGINETSVRTYGFIEVKTPTTRKI